MELAFTVLFWILLVGCAGTSAVLSFIVIWPKLEQAKRNAQVTIVTTFLSFGLTFAVGMIGSSLLGIVSLSL